MRTYLSLLINWFFSSRRCQPFLGSGRFGCPHIFVLSRHLTGQSKPALIYTSSIFDAIVTVNPTEATSPRQLDVRPSSAAFPDVIDIASELAKSILCHDFGDDGGARMLLSLDFGRGCSSVDKSRRTAI